MTTSIYSSYKDLPAYILAQDQFKKAQEIFELTVKAIQTDLKIAEKQFVEERDKLRKSAKWDYYMTEHIINEHGKHYQIHRKAINPQLGDTEFYKDISYGSFKIVNNVFISTGGGYQFQQLKTGDILTDEEIEQLEQSIVPNKFKNTPQFTKDGGYYSNT